ncbi:hypothetical protein BVX97_03905 [bacterium E08(2017)]|nr:hypothetical protein BVX97_03905 [bacterium E08(2017)]
MESAHKPDNSKIICVDESFLFRTMVNTIPDHIYFKDIESRFILINRAMAKLLGVDKPEDAYGKTDFDFFAEEHAQQAFDDEQRIIKTGHPLIGAEEKETWPDGHITWVTTTKVPLKNNEGEIVGTFGISRDITTLKEAESAITDSENRRVMLESFGTACHHMGQPATVILGHSQLLKMADNDFDEETMQIIDQIASSADEIGKILQKMNDINEYRPTKYLESQENSENIIEL